ncbi:MAG: transposase [Actinomycetota bacterium]|nr:transposase [Actinomycetota bacterium]
MRWYRESDPKPVIRRLAEQANIHPQALRNWSRQDECQQGGRRDGGFKGTKIACLTSSL